MNHRSAGQYRWLSLAALLTAAVPASAAPVLVQDGRPYAEIVTARQPPRMARLAATELRDYVLKITGARLPIVTDPTPGVAAQVYVGRSPHTDRLEVTSDGLRHGAFRIAGTGNTLVLLGHDHDFKPPRVFLTSPSDLPQFLKDWDRLTGEHWGFAGGNLFKEFNPDLKIWERDERGSLNAVYEFLRMNGVRWYMPGELGEVVPKRPTLALPQVNRTVRPDFALRYPYQYGRMFAHQGATRDEVLWQLRLGMNLAADVIGDFGVSIAHGMNPLYERSEVRRAHPEYYAVYAGKRDDLKVNEGRPCLSSEGLFRQNVKYVRALFDLLDVPMVSVMPQDGYVNVCQCELCKGKDTLDRGWDGQISDYVWGHADRVAREVYKTHPKKKVSCYAYGAYLLPPTKIATLSPNLVVGICQNRALFHDDAERRKFADLRKAWLAKMPEGSRQLLTSDYYLHLRPDAQAHMPYFFPRAIAADLRALRGISIGDFIEVYREPEGMKTLAVDHLNLYVTSRCWWDAGLDVAALLDEYCADFYGPAAREMKALIEYAEANLADLGKSADRITRVFDLFEKARRKVAPDSAPGKRIALLGDYLRPLKDLGQQLARGRENVPSATAFTRSRADVKLDGKLDDRFWDGLWVNELSELETGKAPYMPTSFKVGWADDAVYFGIRCEDRDTKTLNIGTKRNEDASIWNGDCVEVLLETQAHSYYQLAVNPAGALMDLDRKKGLDSLWSSGAQVATHVGDGYWSAEVRIPVVGPQQALLNPRFGVAGRMPTRSYPWYFNVCRQRFRPSEKEYSAFSPTSKTTFHDLKKFAQLQVR